MAILTGWRSTLVGLAMLAALGTGCQVVDPLVAGTEYSVTAEGTDQTEIKVELKGGENVSRLRQQDLIYDYMIDLSRDPTRDSAAFDAMLELEDLFELHGFPNVKVGYKIDRSDGTKVIFTIEENNQVFLTKHEIDAGPIGREDLEKYLPIRKSGSFGFGDNLYVATDVEALRVGVEHHYRQEGYLDVQVTTEGPTPAIDMSTQEVSIRIRIVPGTRYRIGKIEVEPKLLELIAKIESQRTNWLATHTSEDPPGPEAPKPPESGRPFIAIQSHDYALEITQFLRRWGYPEPEILTSVTPHPVTDEAQDKEAGTVSIQVHGEPGPTATVTRIDVHGQDFVSESNIRERITLRTGRLFDGQREEDSLLRLYRSGLFRTVETKYTYDDSGGMVVEFRVLEGKRYLIQPLIGFGSYEELRGGLEFEMLSVFGTDFDFASKAVVSNRGYRLVSGITDSEFWPSLFGTDTSFNIAVDTFRREEPSFTDGASGLSPSLSQVFTPQLSARVGYIIRDHANADSDVIDPGAQIGAYREGSMVFEVSYDSRDNPIMPTKLGHRAAIQHKWADESLGSEVSFNRTRVSLVSVLPISRFTRFVARAEAGVLFPKTDLDAVPIQERFFNGGETMVRSFREAQLAPADLRDINNRVIGGGYFNIFNAELRYEPQIRLLNTLDLEFAIFADAGNLGRSASDYGVDDLEFGLGAGIRLLLPIGPVRFDYAINPDPKPTDRDSTFHFSIGHAF